MCFAPAGDLFQADGTKLSPAGLRMKADALLYLDGFSSTFSSLFNVTRILSFHMDPAGKYAPWSCAESKQTKYHLASLLEK